MTPYFKAVLAILWVLINLVVLPPMISSNSWDLFILGIALMIVQPPVFYYVFFKKKGTKK